MLKRVVKIAVAVTGSESKYKRHGQTIEVETFPLFGNRSELHNFGCSVAVNLYLQFQLECGLLLLVLALLSIPAWVDNANRSSEREACRDSTLRGADGSLPAGVDLAHCGFTPDGEPNLLRIGSDLSVMLASSYRDSGVMGWLLAFSLGSCQEYSPNMTVVQPIRWLDGAHQQFVTTPGAKFCQDGSLDVWSYRA